MKQTKNKLHDNSIPQGVQTITLGFGLIFGAYVASERFVTAYFATRGEPTVGITALCILYGAYLLTMLVSATVIAKIGYNRALWISTLGYSVFLGSLAVGIVPVVYVAAAILGVCAALLWPAQTAYFASAVKAKHAGAVGGWFASRQALARIIGVICITVLIRFVSYPLAFTIAALFPLLAAVILARTPPLTAKPQEPQPIGRLLRAPTVLGLSAPIFSYYCVLGILFTLIPISLQNVYGPVVVGIFLGVIFGIPLLIGNKLGSMLDSYTLSQITTVFFGILLAGIVIVVTVPGIVGAFFAGICEAVAVSMLPALQLRLLKETGSTKTLPLRNSSGWLFATAGTLLSLLVARTVPQLIAYALMAGVVISTGYYTLRILRQERAQIIAAVDRELIKE